jgi:tape measure domain-containing protein
VAVATVDIQVNSQGAVNSIRNVNAAANQLERQVNNTNRSVKQLETAFAGLGVAVAGMNALNIAKDFFATANAADAAQRRIKMVSTGLDDYRLVLQTARNASAKFGLSQTEAANAVADIYTRLRPVGFGLSEINAIYEGFNTAVKLSSVEAGAASAAFMQLSQGLGSGTLQGDELRSVLEQMPSIAQAIAKEMNTNVGNIKKFGSEGKITSEIIVRALDRIRTEGAEKLATAMDTPQQKIVALGNAMEDFKVAVASDVAPVVIGAIGQITVAIQNATQFITDLRTGFGLLAGAFGGVASGISGINTALSGTIGKFAALGQSKGLMMLLNFMTLGGTSILGGLAGAGAKKNKNKPFAAPIGPEMPIRLSMQGLNLGGGAASKAGKTGGRGGAKSVRESQLVEIQTANGLYRSQETIKARIAKAQLDENQAEVLRLQYVDRGVQLLADAAKIQRDKIPQVEKEAQLRGINDKLIASQNQYQRETFLFQKQDSIQESLLSCRNIL